MKPRLSLAAVAAWLVAELLDPHRLYLDSYFFAIRSRRCSTNSALVH
jgi:hypothetical protein